jgi:hypothetical protein
MDVTGCAFVASVGDTGVESGGGGFTRVGLYDGVDTHAIGIETFFKEAAQQDFPFHLIVSC